MSFAKLYIYGAVYYVSCWASGLSGNIGSTIKLQEKPNVSSDQHKLRFMDLLKWSKIAPHNSVGSIKLV